MGRRDFLADLQAAKASPGSLPATIYDLADGDDDGSFIFLHKLPTVDSAVVSLAAMVPEPSEYPHRHTYFVYTVSGNVPASTQDVLSDTSVFDGMTVPTMLSKLADKLQTAALSHADGNVLIEEDPEFQDASDFDDEEDEAFDQEDFSTSIPIHANSLTVSRARVQTLSAVRFLPEEQATRYQRLRQDIRAVKEAGFRVACIGEELKERGPSFLMISYRVNRLGIQEDTLKAWNLKGNEYLMLMIHYDTGYCFAEELSGDNRRVADVKFRVVLSKRPKASQREAVNIFSNFEKHHEDNGDDSKEGQEELEPETRELFIGRPLNELINERLAALLRYRNAMGLTWQGAEDFYNDYQATSMPSGGVEAKYFVPDTSAACQHLPKIVTADHFQEQPKDRSFPLLAMQFALRHMVRCTEFCLVCHRAVKSNFEALRPYVCSKPLCLYQYMALGFGPSIEHEILAQPHVVDLLISFCYASAVAHSLKALPVGMGLMVPHPCIPTLDGKTLPSWSGDTYSLSGPMPRGQFDVDNVLEVLPKFDERNSELIFPISYKERPFSINQWVYIVGVEVEGHHRRVLETWWPVVRLGPPIFAAKLRSDRSETDRRSDISQERYKSFLANKNPEITPTVTPPPNNSTECSLLPEVRFSTWSTNFDELELSQQSIAVCGLLKFLPSVSEMKAYLRSTSEKSMSLRKWVERIPPATLGLLRWIIVSNRSCIVQVDSLDQNVPRSEARVSGMPGFVQFRFAQGAPDKEQRFMDALSTKKAQWHKELKTPKLDELQTKRIQLGLEHPTIFAWHGSPLRNWHGIVREGLNFEETQHGRAFGHGVYHSLHVGTSEGYSRINGSVAINPPEWFGSELRVSAALCLNEIVNAPTEFVSNSPHIVVAQIDWIQTRYLFVKCAIPEDLIKEETPTQVLQQDPDYSPMGKTHKVIIPITAISKSRRPATTSFKTGNKKVKMLFEESDEDYGYTSDDAEDENIARLLSEDLEERMALCPKTPQTAVTAFVPGSLDQNNLPLLAPPSYASTKATRALQCELKNILKVQATQPSYELGWYLNPELVGNIYQWIFELHSFEISLPLAADMTSKSLSSVVLEMRFGSGFPFSPPFVRVIRPRFLTFMQGGGGHVTAGGALCMELLTNSGWNPASTVEAVLLQVRMAITSLDPKPARLEQGLMGDYSSAEAFQAYLRACHTHGWRVPKDFAALSTPAEGMIGGFGGVGSSRVVAGPSSAVSGPSVVKPPL